MFKLVEFDSIKNVAVIGGGIMGSGIAQVALLTGYEKVTIIDLNSKILEQAIKLIQTRIEDLESEEQFKNYFASDERMENFDIKKTLENFEFYSNI